MKLETVRAGSTTDYVDRQYIGNLGKIENGIVSVNAYGIVGQLTFPTFSRYSNPSTQSRRCVPNEVAIGAKNVVKRSASKLSWF